jgi:NADH pyrophosphatase NudC (nudix superfamily)
MRKHECILGSYYIIGLCRSNSYECGTESDLIELTADEDQQWEWNNKNKYCPECGKKINWKEINKKYKEG